MLPATSSRLESTTNRDLVSRIGLTLGELIVTALIVLASIVIAVGVQHPAMYDASSHIATAVIAEKLLEGDAFYSAHYEFQTKPLPYWATTLLLLPLLQFVGPMVAFDILLVLYCLSLPLAYWWLLRTAAPANTPMVMVGALMIFNWNYWLGETNFVFGIPVMIAAFAAFLGIRHIMSVRFLVFGLLAGATYLCHLFLVVALLTSVLALASVQMIGRFRPDWNIKALNRAQWLGCAWVGTLFAAAAWFVLLSHGTDANRGELVFLWGIYRAVSFQLLPFETMAFLPRFPVTVFLFCLAAILVIPHLAAWRAGRPEKQVPFINYVLLWPALALFVLTQLGPTGVQEEFSLEYVSDRFPIMATLFGLGAIRLSSSRRWRVLLMAVVVVFSSFKLYDASIVHARNDETVMGVRTGILEQIPDQSKVLAILDADEPGPQEYFPHRLVDYLVIDGDAYDPHVFARTGQQPLRHIPWGDYRPLLWREVSDREWDFYDFLLVQSPYEVPRIPGLLAKTRLEKSSGDFRLYRVDRE